ncbi:MAG: thioredoxin domain-containing protein [Nanoarchaeota archaeon]
MEQHEHHEHYHKRFPLSGALAIINVLSVILLIIIAFQLYQMNVTLKAMSPFAAGDTTAPTAPAAPLAQQPAPTPTVDMVKLADDDAVHGSADAPVTMIEFSEYQCPYCARFVQQTLPQIEEKYIKTGKVKHIFRDFPLGFHQNAQKAAEAAECAGEQGKYYEMHDKLFANQADLGVDNYKKWAQELGLNTGDFNTCLDSGRMAAEIQKDMADGQAAGVRGTPAFLINGQLVSGAQPFASFETVIEAKLKG